LIPLLAWKIFTTYYPLPLRTTVSPFDPHQRARAAEVWNNTRAKKNIMACGTGNHCSKKMACVKNPAAPCREKQQSH
jgi:hypothetical protein